MTRHLPSAAWLTSITDANLCLYLNRPPLSSPTIHMWVLLPLLRPPHYEGTTMPSSHHYKHYTRYSVRLNGPANYIDFRGAMLFALAEENGLPFSVEIENWALFRLYNGSASWCNSIRSPLDYYFNMFLLTQTNIVFYSACYMPFKWLLYNMVMESLYLTTSRSLKPPILLNSLTTVINKCSVADALRDIHQWQIRNEDPVAHVCKKSFLKMNEFKSGYGINAIMHCDAFQYCK